MMHCVLRALSAPASRRVRSSSPVLLLGCRDEGESQTPAAASSGAAEDEDEGRAKRFVFSDLRSQPKVRRLAGRFGQGCQIG
jgi:hypothetical protein